jgi:hypothetical protein
MPLPSLSVANYVVRLRLFGDASHEGAFHFPEVHVAVFQLAPQSKAPIVSGRLPLSLWVCAVPPRFRPIDETQGSHGPFRLLILL